MVLSVDRRSQAQEDWCAFLTKCVFDKLPSGMGSWLDSLLMDQPYTGIRCLQTEVHIKQDRVFVLFCFVF